jgi:hypothetical protein
MVGRSWRKLRPKTKTTGAGAETLAWEAGAALILAGETRIPVEAAEPVAAGVKVE